MIAAGPLCGEDPESEETTEGDAPSPGTGCASTSVKARRDSYHQRMGVLRVPPLWRPANRIEPVVLPFAPRTGWLSADRRRRRFALLAVALPGVWGASLPFTPSLDDPGALWIAASIALTLLVALAGPPACHSAARILRPHLPGTGGERLARHWCAAIATAYGFAALTPFTQGHGLAPSFGLYLFVLGAVSLGPATIIWGVVAALRRAYRRSRGSY